MVPFNDNAPSRYSCHECREDAELVMSSRATAEVRGLYETHLRRCRECRRMHRLLYAVYEGPPVPTPPNGVQEEKAFYGVLRRMSEEGPDPWYHKLSVRAGITALAASAAVLTLTLFDVAPGDFQLPDLSVFADADGSEQHAAQTPASDAEIADPLGDPTFQHPAQSYGRIVGGNATLLSHNGQAQTTNTFPVGVRFEVPQSDAVQVGLIGKIVANFTPGSHIEWTKANASQLELRLDRGIAAFRYDRKDGDPILQVRTPSAVVRVVGTIFTVQVSGPKDTVVSVLRGQVEVLRPADMVQIAEVESGYRYDSRQGTWGDVGKVEVQAAMPLSDASSAGGAGDGLIPVDWNVPGLSSDAEMRTLAQVPTSPGEPTWQVPAIRVAGTGGGTHDEQPLAVKPPPRRHDEGADLLRELTQAVAATRRKELNASLAECRRLFASGDTRYRAGECLAKFLDKYGKDPRAAEAYLLVGMLRADYGTDYRAAEVAFQTFLRRAPKAHARREFAHYRMWLSATEDGRISQAVERGRRYLSRYPNGQYVGKILQRFPELKSEI